MRPWRLSLPRALMTRTDHSARDRPFTRRTIHPRHHLARQRPFARAVISPRYFRIAPGRRPTAADDSQPPRLTGAVSSLVVEPPVERANQLPNRAPRPRESARRGEDHPWVRHPGQDGLAMQLDEVDDVLGHEHAAFIGGDAQQLAVGEAVELDPFPCSDGIVAPAAQLAGDL